MRLVREVAFWVVLVLHTLTGRRLSRVLAARGLVGKIAVKGLDAIPERGGFVLAVNHYRSGATLDVLAALDAAIGRARPELADGALVVVGRRAPAKRTWRRRFIAGIVERFFAAWSRNVIRIPWKNASPELASLRAWRFRTRTQPTIVFPEGRSSLEL